MNAHPQWKDKYVKLRERCSELITDIDIIETELAKERSERPKIRLPDRSQSRSYDDLGQAQDVYGSNTYKRFPLLDEDFVDGLPLPHFLNRWGYAHTYPQPNYYSKGSHDDSHVFPNVPEMVFVPPDRLAEQFPYRKD